ncbi:biotin--[acetyl-CoA-carboxylase] ligase [Alteribacillus sp. HJP-4]|uniref:biotin--[acetyl-CoA-carboxylase] ligase n=1 Tax=Alteribacillus sp. HJP-4 TaxID=2775394 RepID=UPI0035CCF4BA
MRDKLLKLLDDPSTEYVSGQEISTKLGISRTAVWKHIEELRKNGYQLEAVPRKGYKLTHTPNVASADEVKSRLNTTTIGKDIIFKKELPSTQKLAHDMARNEAEEGTVIVADQQLEGKGRLGRSWHSPAGTGLWFSIILRPDVPPHHAPQLTLLTAVAAAEGIESATGVKAEIKWPNDILFKGKKIAGILTEMQSDPDKVQAVIVGIGMNVNQEKHQFPSELSDKATSLAIEAGRTFHRADVIAAILERYEYLYFYYLKEGFEGVRKRWEALAVTIGKNITARTVAKTFTGRAKGITDDGVLMLETASGRIEYIYSADIE